MAKGDKFLELGGGCVEAFLIAGFDGIWFEHVDPGSGIWIVVEPLNDFEPFSTVRHTVPIEVRWSPPPTSWPRSIKTTPKRRSDSSAWFSSCW